MSHLSRFHAIRFRGISGLRLDPLAQVNLITGANGIGKTSVAEAIRLFDGRFDPAMPWNPSLQRSTRALVNPVSRLGNGAVELAGEERGIPHRWKAEFEPVSGVSGPGTLGNPHRSGPPSGDRQTAAGPQPFRALMRGQLRIWLDGTETAGTQLTMVTTDEAVIVPNLTPPIGRTAGAIHTQLCSMDIEVATITGFSKLVEQGQKEELGKALRMIMPALSDVEVVTDQDGRPYILACTTHGERLPLQAVGGGMTRLFRLFVSFHSARGGIVIVDEIENGLHYEVLPELWRRIRAMTATYDAQVFATTHSRECLLAAMDVFDDQPNALAVHSLYRKKGAPDVQASTYTGETLQAVRDLDLEIR